MNAMKTSTRQVLRNAAVESQMNDATSEVRVAAEDFECAYEFLKVLAGGEARTYTLTPGVWRVGNTMWSVELVRA
jgi:hypothetical protein